MSETIVVMFLGIGLIATGLVIWVATDNTILMDGSGVANDLSSEQMQDIANYIEEKYPANFNYRSSFADPISHNGCPCPQRSDL